MTNAQWVFDTAIYLMDGQRDDTGQTDTAQTKPYRLRALGVLTLLCWDLLPYNHAPSDEAAGFSIVESWQAPLPLDDALSKGVLPYGLAARLLLGEHDALATYFERLFRGQLAGVQRKAFWEQLQVPYEPVAMKGGNI